MANELFMSEIPKKDWNEVVKNSGGRSFFVPDALQAQVKEWQEARKKLRELTEVAAEQEVKTSVAMQNMFLELRKYAIETGIEGVWTADIGFDTQALEDGVFVVNVVDAIK